VREEQGAELHAPLLVAEDEELDDVDETLALLLLFVFVVLL
jgi:hypothetical protein